MNRSRLPQSLLTLANFNTDALRCRLFNRNILTLMWVLMSSFGPNGPLSVAEGIWIDQRPHNLSVTEGGTANLTCDYSAAEIRDFEINWLHQPINQINQTYVIYMNSCKTNQSIRVVQTKDRDRNMSQISITHLQRGDSGTYYCELMVLSMLPSVGMKGNGSTLIVTEKTSSRTSQETWLYLLLCPSVILCVISLVAVCRWEAKRKQLTDPSVPSTGTGPQDTARADRTIYATVCSAKMKETLPNLEIVYSDPLVEKNVPSTSTAQVDYSTVNFRRADPKTEDDPMVYSQLNFKENEAQFLTPCLQ
ncbi:uncharacterized protein LOC119977397 [Scyliorhinus canicula]|uniref:uncharacterized protein LOC119977397 n=1 Tax=Scyliorhinus canicula TaxID=7830 RepID=UPI0018F5C673|nr:uncharacterized protein LOC119977397 [Scyliorhinus canicula]